MILKYFVLFENTGHSVGRVEYSVNDIVMFLKEYATLLYLICDKF